MSPLPEIEWNARKKKICLRESGFWTTERREGNYFLFGVSFKYKMNRVSNRPRANKSTCTYRGRRLDKLCEPCYADGVDLVLH